MSSLQSSRTSEASQCPPPAYSLLLSFPQCGVRPGSGHTDSGSPGREEGIFCSDNPEGVIHIQSLVCLKDQSKCPGKESGEKRSHLHERMLAEGRSSTAHRRSKACFLQGKGSPPFSLSAIRNQNCDERPTLAQRKRPGIWSCSMTVFPFHWLLFNLPLNPCESEFLFVEVGKVSWTIGWVNSASEMEIYVTIYMCICTHRETHIPPDIAHLCMKPTNVQA